MPDNIRTTLYLDRELVQTAKELGFNISKLTENCLKHAITKMTAPNQHNNPEIHVTRNTTSRRRKEKNHVVGSWGFEPQASGFLQADATAGQCPIQTRRRAPVSIV